MADSLTEELAKYKEELAKSRIETVEARTDRKFSDMLGEMRTGFAKIDTRLDGLERSTSGIKATVIGSVLAAAALIAAMIAAVLTYGQTGFGFGISMRDIVRAATTEAAQQQHPSPANPPPPSRAQQTPSGTQKP